MDEDVIANELAAAHSCSAKEVGHRETGGHEIFNRFLTTTHSCSRELLELPFYIKDGILDTENVPLLFVGFSHPNSTRKS